jgi:hypothetical protein
MYSNFTFYKASNYSLYVSTRTIISFVNEYKKLNWFNIVGMREKQLPRNIAILLKSFSMVFMLCLLTLSTFNLFGGYSNALAFETLEIPEQNRFTDLGGNLNIAGVVRNDGDIPVRVVVGLNTTNKIPNDGTSTESEPSTVQSTTYGRIVYPSSSSPFKFVVPSGELVLGKASIVNIKQEPIPLYDNLILNYSNIPEGDDKALVGTVKNTGPLDLYDVSVYASVHNNNRTQIDSVKSNSIPVVKSGQELPFSAVPDASVKESVMYFSCAGLDFDEPMTTLKVDDDQFIPYDLQALAKISSLEYVNVTDSISFGVKHYNPDGGDLSLKVPQLSQNQTILVKMDDEMYDNASVEMDGKTIHVDLFVPPGDHEIDIQGVRDDV